MNTLKTIPGLLLGCMGIWVALTRCDLIGALVCCGCSLSGVALTVLMFKPKPA